MKETTFKVRRQYHVEIPIKIGDTIVYNKGYGEEDGKVTHFFDDGKQAIVNDKDVISTSCIKEVNGVHIKYIEGEMTVI